MVDPLGAEGIEGAGDGGAAGEPPQMRPVVDAGHQESEDQPGDRPAPDLLTQRAVPRAAAVDEQRAEQAEDRSRGADGEGGPRADERQRREEPIWWQTMKKIHRLDPSVLLGWWEAEDRRQPGFAPAMLAGVTCPALVIGGDRDPIIPLDQTLKLYRALPNAQLAILPGVGHGAPRRAQLFNLLVLEFLSRIGSRIEERPVA